MHNLPLKIDDLHHRLKIHSHHGEFFHFSLIHVFQRFYAVTHKLINDKKKLYRQGIRNGSIPAMQCWSDIHKPVKNHDEIFYKILGIDPRLMNISQFSEDCLYLNIYLPDGEYKSV